MPAWGLGVTCAKYGQVRMLHRPVAHLLTVTWAVHLEHHLQVMELNIRIDTHKCAGGCRQLGTHI